uniref:Ovule protein n=1 Tax=Panagrolaimus sp. ES5 TaxID=591445 RepID=A0AC34FPW3_9BILA
MFFKNFSIYRKETIAKLSQLSSFFPIAFILKKTMSPSCVQSFFVYLCILGKKPLPILVIFLWSFSFNIQKNHVFLPSSD